MGVEDPKERRVKYTYLGITTHQETDRRSGYNGAGSNFIIFTRTLGPY